MKRKEGGRGEEGRKEWRRGREVGDRREGGNGEEVGRGEERRREWRRGREGGEKREGREGGEREEREGGVKRERDKAAWINRRMEINGR